MRAEINVLGALEVSIDGTSVVPNASKPRHLLAVLAMNVGKLVTSSSLKEELWGNHAPRSATSTLQTHVLSLRNHIREALPSSEDDLVRDILVTRNAGYVLRLDPDSVDVIRYTRLAAAGRAASGAGDHERAGQLLTEALALWRGPVLDDVSVGPQLEIESMRLAECRLADLTLRIDMDLYLGRHHQVLGDLAALCAQHPYMENFRAQFMLALYRSGRPGQALEVYHEMWATIRDHLGVDPSPRLRELHRAILAGDAMVDDPRFMVNAWQRGNAIAS
ncbi:AfsR/SARP family transcriptional regulator [Actinophytocola oryzae]|uniref:DNA-binding SARP family transcriptional activator n=1 Tax=Actinophytocola oryzae TaxID=502181 RepID=A0A4R7UZU8_9PSEU|nr:AfsR/SARP family transcriptional regulator [Actinophytocola oryzae]TDV41075.1 DNA-binding SARP family transcriptional activator [Actinophytocola oryzae]